MGDLNQRQFFRVDIRMETQYRILQYGSRKFRMLSKVVNRAAIINLSAGGAALESNCPIHQGVVVGFKLFLGLDVLDIVGTVRWATKAGDRLYHVGVQFDNLDDVNKKRS